MSKVEVNESSFKKYCTYKLNIRNTISINELGNIVLMVMLTCVRNASK